MEGKHKEIPVKVNAWVDEGVASAVKALNLHAPIITVDSCEGDPEKGENGWAHVYFVHQEGGDKLAEFVVSLGRKLGKSSGGPMYRLSLDFVVDQEEPMAVIRFNSNYSDWIALRIQRFIEEYEKWIRT